jgi:hypothetical protein
MAEAACARFVPLAGAILTNKTQVLGPLSLLTTHALPGACASLLAPHRVRRWQWLMGYASPFCLGRSGGGCGRMPALVPGAGRYATALELLPSLPVTLQRGPAKGMGA